MKKVHITTIILGGLLTIGVLLGISPTSMAASNSLGINPRRDYVVQSGETYNDTLFVTNLSKTDDLNITIDLVDFGPKDQTGSPSLLLTQKEPTRWSLKPYLKITDEYTISAGKSAEIPFTITIPDAVGAGSYYSAIKYSTGGTTTSDNLSLTSSSVSLIFVRVPGEAKNQLELEKFGAFTPNAQATDGTYGSFYGSTAPKYLSYRLKNLGNVAEQPTGSILLKNIFGKQVKLYENANPSNNIVLIDQARRFDLCLNESRTERTDTETGRNIEETACDKLRLMPGRYTATLGLVYGDNGSSSRELQATASFWYLPGWFIALVLLVIFVTVFGVRRVVRKSNRTRFKK